MIMLKRSVVHNTFERVACQFIVYVLLFFNLSKIPKWHLVQKPENVKLVLYNCLKMFEAAVLETHGLLLLLPRTQTGCWDR